MERLSRFARRILAGQDGATMVEYALMVALIAAACVAAVMTFGGALVFEFQKAITSFN